RGEVDAREPHESPRRCKDIADRLAHVDRYDGGAAPAPCIGHGEGGGDVAVARDGARDGEAARREGRVREPEAERVTGVVTRALTGVGARQLVEELRLVSGCRCAAALEVARVV